MSEESAHHTDTSERAPEQADPTQNLTEKAVAFVKENGDRIRSSSYPDIISFARENGFGDPGELVTLTDAINEDNKQTPERLNEHGEPITYFSARRTAWLEGRDPVPVVPRPGPGTQAADADNHSPASLDGPPKLNEERVRWAESKIQKSKSMSTDKCQVR